MSDRLCPQWHKSTYSSDNGACVEVGDLPTTRLVRDSKLGQGSPVHSVPVGQWSAFIRAVAGGQFD